MARLIEMERAKLRESKRVDAPYWLAPLASAIQQIPIQREKVRMYQGNKLDDTYDALVNLLKVADSEAGMKLYEKKLGEFTTDTQKLGGFEDNIVQAETLKLLGNQKKQMHSDFSTAIQNSSDFINTTQFLDTADEFVNIQDTIDRLNKDLKADGKTEHKSVANFLQSELAYANSLRDNMVAGFQIGKDGEVVGTNFRYNKAETNDKETFRKLNLYRDRLELATYSLAGDKRISAKEAEAILIGNKEQYFAAKSAAIQKAAYNYKANKGMVIKYDGFINTALQKKLTGTDIFNMDDMDEAGKLELGDKLTSGSWDAIVEQLRGKQGEYQELKNIANDNYKDWYGEFFEEAKGGMTVEEIEAFNLKLAQEQEALEEKKKKEEQIKLEETKERYKEPKEEEKLQTYSIDEKSDAESLLTSYVGGDISDSVLKDIGGQSLLNHARIVKNAYKGQKPKATIIPGVKTKGVTPEDIEAVKKQKFKIPGKAMGRYTWDDVVSEIHSGGKGKTQKVVSYLTDDYSVFDLRWQTRRNRVHKIKSKFKKSKLSIDEFKNKYPKDYKELTNLLAKAEIR